MGGQARFGGAGAGGVGGPGIRWPMGKHDFRAAFPLVADNATLFALEVPSAFGAPSLEGLTASGAAVMIPSGAGAVDLGELEAAGSDITHTATGDPALEELSASGAGLHGQTASGDPTLDELTADGAALHSIPVYGESFLPQLVAEGFGAPTLTGTAAVDLGELTASGTQGTVGAASLGLLSAAGAALVAALPAGGDLEPPASGSGGVGGVDICLDVDLGIEDEVTGIVRLLPQPVVLRLKARRRVIHRTPSGYARATILPGREAVIQWGESYLPVEDMAVLLEAFAARVNLVRWKEPDGTPIRMRCRRDSFKTRWSWAQPGFYDPLVLTLTETP